MPSLGADMDAGTLVEWLVHEGDTIHRGDPMAVVDTDKSAIEVESFDDGVVESFLVEPGTRVAVGTPLASLTPLAAPAAAVAPETPAPAPPRTSPEQPTGAPTAAPTGAPTKPPAEAPTRAPSVAPPGGIPKRRIGTPPLRHHAAELGVDLAKLTGSGAHGEITRADVDRAADRRTRRVSPYARRLAGELGVDLAELNGSGRGGSIRAEDVLGAVAARSTAPTAEAPAAGLTPAARTRGPADTRPGAGRPSS